MKCNKPTNNHYPEQSLFITWSGRRILGDHMSFRGNGKGMGGGGSQSSHIEYKGRIVEDWLPVRGGGSSESYRHSCVWPKRFVHEIIMFYDWDSDWPLFLILTVSSITEATLTEICSRDAVQVYLPESSLSGLQIWSVPSSLTFDLPLGNSPPFFAHVIKGLGWPVAWQRTVIVLFEVASSLAGGRTVNFGIFTTVSLVYAEWYPMLLEAIHWYKPESSILAFVIDSCPFLGTALSWFRLSSTLNQVNIAGGTLLFA